MWLFKKLTHFIFMSDGADAVNRVGMFGADLALTSHYAIYSILLFGILLAWAVSRGKKLGVLLGGVVLAVAIVNTIYGINCQEKRLQC